MDQSFLITLKSIEEKFSRCINASKQKQTNFTDILISVESDLKNLNIALTSKKRLDQFYFFAKFIFNFTQNNYSLAYWVITFFSI